MYSFPAELFPNLRAERRGADDAPPADPEPDTDVGAPLDCPSDILAVLQPNGSTYRPAANDSEAEELLEAAGWIDWDAAAGLWDRPSGCRASRDHMSLPR